MTRAIMLMLIALLPREAAAQQTIIYGADGRRSATVVTGSNGTSTIYDAAGRRAGTVSPPPTNRSK